MDETGLAYTYERDGTKRAEPCHTPDFAAEIDTLEDELMEKCHGMTLKQAIDEIAKWHRSVIAEETHRVEARIIRSCAGLILDGAGDVRLRVYGIAFAAGLDHLLGITMTEAAEKLGVTRAAVSKHVVKASYILGLPRSRYQKSEKACESYRARAIEVHRKNKLPQSNAAND